ncbi:uncharacterized protein [Haliotis asinina]|uniref:uncharacterized protein n=1 Tax=Haliotis asinina TaxID=109174 RepID=UPI0035321364
MMIKVCLALFFVVSLLVNNAFGFGCRNEGQTCSWMNGNTCCNGLTCQRGIGNIQTCRRNYGSGIGGGMGCRRRNDECRINGMPAMSCCASLRCLPGYMNRMTCQ